MARPSSHDLRSEHSCHCGAPRPALRLAFIAAIVTLVAALLIAGVQLAGATSLGDSSDGRAFGPACAPLPIVAQHRYRMAAKIRPLLFWIGRDNVGEARLIWRRGPADAQGFEMLIGSDPDRAPRRINRWGYIAEETIGSRACVVGVMKQSDEESIEEAKSRLAKEAQDGRHVFKAIRGVSGLDEAHAGVTTVKVTRDLTFRDLEVVLNAASAESPTNAPKSVRLPAETRPGFLVALAELIHTSVEAHRSAAAPRASRSAGPLTYVYNGDFHDLTLRRWDLIREWRVGSRSVANVVRAEFEWRNRKTGEESQFELTYGTDGPFAEIPLHASYQPRWWFQVDLVLDDPGTF
jgi:hypothetical protein